MKFKSAISWCLGALVLYGCAFPKNSPTSQGISQSKPIRVGRLIYWQDFREKTVTFADAYTGKVIRVTDAGWKESTAPYPYTGIPIWDSPKRRLFIIGKGDKPNDTKEVVEMIGDGWAKGKRVWLSDFAFGFEKMVGNPEIGPFAVFEASNRATYLTGLFRKDLSRIKTDALDVADISGRGILAIRGTRNASSDIVPSELICINPVSGKVRWRTSKYLTGKWEGRNVRSGKVILSGRSGRVI